MDRIKTKLKFVKSDRSDAWVGFVSINTKNGCIKGVREDSKEPKKVCVATRELAPCIQENILYDVEMVPMKTKNSGYVVVKAEPHMFEAVVESTIVKNAVYTVNVKFGNKVVVYDPLDGHNDSVRTIAGVLKVLEERKDIKNVISVIDDFIRQANIVLTTYENDGHYVPKKHKISIKRA